MLSTTFIHQFFINGLVINGISQYFVVFDNVTSVINLNGFSVFMIHSSSFIGLSNNTIA